MTSLTRREMLAASAAAAGACALSGCSSQPAPVRPTGAVVLDISEVAPGQGKLYAAERAFVVRHDDGSVVAFDPTCPHERCAVTSVREGQVLCPCHGSSFDPTTGERLAGPARTGLRVLRTTLNGAQLTIEPS